jgi:hypothetical protein
MSEPIYDEQVAPLLMEAGRICKENGLPFIAVVEYAPGEFGQTQHFTETQGLAMTMANIAARAHGNLDAFMLSLLRHCRERGIDTSASIFARLPGGTP